MLLTFSHRLLISLFFTLRICYLLDGDVAFIYGQMSKNYGKKQAIHCIVHQYFKIWFLSKYCGRTCRKSTVEMQGERTVVSGIYVIRC